MTIPSEKHFSEVRRWRVVLAITSGALVLLGVLLAFGRDALPFGEHAAVASHLGAVALGAAIALICTLLTSHRQGGTHTPAASSEPRSGVFDADSLERVRIAAQAAGIGVFDWDIAGGKLIVDRNRLDMFSESARAAIENPAEFVRLIVHPDDLEHYTREMTLAVREKTNFVMSYRQMHADGEPRHVQLHGHVSRDASGRPVRVFGITLDMTAQIAATQRIEQQALEQQRSIERLDLATRAAGVGIWDMDLTTGKLVGDTNMAQLWEQRDKNEFPSLVDFLRKAVHPEDLPNFERALFRTMKCGSQIEHHYREVRPDGSVHHIQFHGKIYRDSNGAPVRFLAVTVNVSAQVETRQALQERTKEQATLLERLNLATRVGGIGVWDWDLASDSMTVDRSIARAYGIDDLRIERDARAFCTRAVHHDDVEAFQVVLQRGLDSGNSFSHRHRAVLADGSVRHVQFHAHVFRDQNAVATRVLGVTIDATAEVARTEQLQLQAAAERALRDRLNLATQTAGIGVWDMDLATRKVSSDAYTKDLLGLQGELDDAALSAGIHPEDRAQVLASIDAAMRDPSHNGLVSLRHRVAKADGEIRHIQTHIRIFRDDTAIATSMLGVTWDVTAEVEHSQELQAQAQRVQSLLERISVASKAAGISAWEYDLSSRQFVWVENRTKAFGLDDVSLEEFTRGVNQLMHPDDAAEMESATKQAIENHQQTYSYRFRVMRSDGTVRYCQAYVQILRDEQDQAIRLLGATNDITNEVQTNELLQRQAAQERALSERLSMATDAAGICSWEIDLKSQRFLWTENWLKALGDSKPEDSDSTELFVAARLHPEDTHVLEHAIRDTLRAKRDRFSCRYRAIGADGNVVYVTSHARLIFDEKGWAHRLLGMSWDITREVHDTKLLEEQAQQQSVLLERLKLSSEAAGICSFEIDMERGVFLWSENPIKSLTTVDLRGMSMEGFSELVMVPGDRHVFRDSARQALKERQSSFSLRYRGIGKDGSIIHVQNHANFVIDPTSGRAIRLLGVCWDITANVEAAEKLERQSVEQRLLFERLSIATQVADISSWELDLTKPEFRWLENPIQALLYDGDEVYTVAELQKRIHPEDRDLLSRRIREALTTGTDRVSYRYRGFRVDGSIIHIQNYVKLFFGDNNLPVTALGASWDVTKEIEAAERLEQQAEQLRLAESRLERASLSSSEGHWESDLVNRRLWLSSSYHALLGYKEGELTTQPSELESLLHREDLEAHRMALHRHLADGAAFVFDARMRCGNGEYRWFRQRGTAERGANGKPISMSGSIHDIHEQKLAENALQLAQRRFERAINGTQDGLWELEANGTAWSSPRLRELLGYSIEEFPSHTNFLREFLHPDDAAAVATATQTHFQQDLPYDVEIRLRTKSGDYRWYRARASAERDAAGRPLRMSGSLQDVTEARTAREELERAHAAAEAASNAKSSFLANVSHEIRTPMNGIIGMTGLLLDTALDRTQRDYAQTIRGSADSLLIVINDILDFSKIEAGKLEIESLELDLRGNVEDVGGMMAFQAAAKNLELVVHVHPDVPDRVIGDPQRIRQCLINLVGNAIKFTREGEIVIEVSTVGSREGKVLAQFQVRDTGIGIAPETLKTLFQPFVQADASTTRHFGGTGLGLSIVRRLVEMMDGAVGVESEPGKGSTFWFTLPLVPAAGSSQSRQPDLHRLGRRVLIVDDNDTNRRVLAGQLMHAGYEVSLAQTGAEALQLLRQGLGDNHPYDIVLADYQMADMDGAALGERINADPHLSRARIVILTSLDRHGDIRRFASLGFAGYLTKPVRARELFECLDRVLAREAKEWHLQSQPMITRGALVNGEAGRRYEGLVLLVEDNPVNQKVAVRFLERMGCQVRVADNGAEGVKAYGESRFDIVLMDLQMPVMDGLTATRRIREIEALSGESTPIVALTANAMAGQLERCMEAGMNGFLTKPLEIERLHEILEQYGLAVQPGEQHTSVASASATPVNLARLNEITDGDPEFAFELASTFISSGEQVLEEIQVALEAFDRNGLSRAAHKLKGASANIHAENLRELAYALETHAGAVDQPRLRELVSQLREGFEIAAEFLKEQAPPPAARAG